MAYSDGGVRPGTTIPTNVNKTRQNKGMSNIELGVKKTIAKKKGNTYSDRGISSARGGPIVHDAVTTTPSGQVTSQFTGKVSDYNQAEQEAKFAARKAAEQNESEQAAAAVVNAVKSYNPGSGGGKSGGFTESTGTSSTSSSGGSTPKPTTTGTSSTSSGTSKPNVSDVATRVGTKHSRSAQGASTNRRSPRKYNSLTEQELRKLAARAFR